MNITNWIDAFNFFGALLALFIVVSQLLLEKKNQRNYILVAAFISISLFIFSSNFHIFKGIDNWYELAPFIFHFYTIPLHGALVFLFIFLYTLGQKELRFNKKHLLLFIPGLIDLVTDLIFGRSPVHYNIPPEKYLEYINSTVLSRRISLVPASVLILIFTLLVIKKNYSFFMRAARHRFRYFSPIWFLAGLIIFLLIMYALYYMGIQSFAYFMKLRFTIFTITIFILSYRYPHVLNISKLGANQNYSFNTNTINLDVERIINELNTLSNDMAVLSDSVTFCPTPVRGRHWLIRGAMLVLLLYHIQ